MTTFDFYYFTDQIVKEYIHSGTPDMKVDLDIRQDSLVLDFYLLDETNKVQQRLTVRQDDDLDETYDIIDQILGIIGGIPHE